jgi:hypothetical protein
MLSPSGYSQDFILIEKHMKKSDVTAYLIIGIVGALFMSLLSLLHAATI